MFKKKEEQKVDDNKQEKKEEQKVDDNKQEKKEEPKEKKENIQQVLVTSEQLIHFKLDALAEQTKGNSEMLKFIVRCVLDDQKEPDKE